MKPTDEQIKEFWEWCGIKAYPHTGHEDDYQYPNNRWGKQPKIGLNNLFKYAVPKVATLDMVSLYPPNKSGEDGTEAWSCILTTEDLMKDTVAQGDTPALALFWTIWKVSHAV